MKKNVRLLFLLLLTTFCRNAYAAEKTNCGLFGDGSPGSVAYYLQESLTIMKYIGIVLCVVLTIMDFVKSIMLDEKDNFKELTKKAIKRLIYAVVLFFLPIVVDALLSALGLIGACNII